MTTKIERVVRHRETLAVAMPRGSGKTTLCLVAVLWSVLSGQHEFVFLIASAQEAALSMLANIKSHLGGNEMLLADYPRHPAGLITRPTTRPSESSRPRSRRLS